jgi:hypothetical protein
MLCYRIDFVGFAIKNRLLSGLFFVLPLREPRERGYPSNIIYYTVRGCGGIVLLVLLIFFIVY